MLKFLLTLTLAGFATAAIWADDDKMMTAEKLVGTYRMTKGEKYGGTPPSEPVADIVVKITTDRITSYDASDKEVYVQTYKLDSSVKPCKIMMKAVKPKVDMEAMGLIKVEGDTLMLIYALPGGEMPTEFKTKEKQLMFVMKKVKDAK